MERRRTRQPPARPLVLLADGHADTCDLYAESLACFGFEVLTVADGENAFEHAWKAHPDVIVTKVCLPELDGWHLIRDVKHDARTRNIPVVIVTTDDRRDARSRANQEACSAFLLKPCLPEDLAETLRQVVAHADARHRSPSG